MLQPLICAGVRCSAGRWWCALYRRESCGSGRRMARDQWPGGHQPGRSVQGHPVNTDISRYRVIL